MPPKQWDETKMLKIKDCHEIKKMGEIDQGAWSRYKATRTALHRRPPALWCAVFMCNNDTINKTLKWQHLIWIAN